VSANELWFEQEKAAMNLFLARGEIRAGRLGWVFDPFFVALHYAVPDYVIPGYGLVHASLP